MAVEAEKRDSSLATEAYIKLAMHSPTIFQQDLGPTNATLRQIPCTTGAPSAATLDQSRRLFTEMQVMFIRSPWRWRTRQLRLAADATQIDAYAIFKHLGSAPEAVNLTIRGRLPADKEFTIAVASKGSANFAMKLSRQTNCFCEYRITELCHLLDT
jgi:hypothetical protein